MRFREYQCRYYKCWFRVYDLFDVDSVRCPVWDCEGKIRELQDND